ncbi:hypothetical protein [Sphingomonas sp.]|uniref:hypothetical protein n=1 Tax=Sphingomonas sp. TaxID=28214 RepID=UPI002C4A7589|nr:hypothetical protein [Sphingomonas sp.]HWK35389.1 hypothetical protein [Sphingomonas sp.]
MRRRALLPLAFTALIGAKPADISIVAVDPLTVQDDDFARHRDPAEWRGLKVSRVTFAEERAQWRLWRIVDPTRPDGPLWFVPHDNENAGFEAALVALRKYGGTLIAVDAGVAPGHDGERLNRAVAFGRPIDPNRNFHDGLPLYPSQVLAAVAKGAWPIIALHTNSRGYDPRESTCPPLGDTSGSGVISIRYCDATLSPSASQGQAYPFDDDDTVAFATHLATQPQSAAFCHDAMVAADWNVVRERVMNSDGSLSNYAVLHRLAYLNFETQDLGLDPAELAKARDRLSWIVDRAMAMCAAPAARPTAPPVVQFR